jgi:hypothetical protein
MSEMDQIKEDTYGQWWTVEPVVGAQKINVRDFLDYTEALANAKQKAMKTGISHAIFGFSRVLAEVVSAERSTTFVKKIAALFVVISLACVFETPALAEFYGAGIGGDSLANTPVGGPYNSMAFYRFKATQSAHMTAFRFYYIGVAPGYGGGTGGTWRVSVHPDDGTASHLPASTVLVEQIVAPQTAHAAGRLLVFDTPPALVAGQLYHLVFENVDADPIVNYWSLDTWYYDEVPTGAFGGRFNPKYLNSDWGHGILYKDEGGGWEDRPGWAPVLEVIYANGESHGQSYGEGTYEEGQVGLISCNGNMVREKFTVTGGNKIINKIGFRVLRETGSSAGHLTVRLENSAGFALRTANIPASAIADGPGFDPSLGDRVLQGVDARWKEILVGGLMLKNGQTYQLRFSTNSCTRYWAWTIRHLNHYDYTPNTYFSDGIAEKTTDGANWSPLGRVPGEHDLQFYFR